MSFMAKPLTEEELAVEAAIDAHMDALSDEAMVMKTGFGLNIIGFPLFIFGSGMAERIGMALILTSLLCILIAMGLGIRTAKRRFEAKRLVDAYMRKKALPFYQELTEMFADKQVHVHLEDDGRITVTDKRKEKENG